jgi:hypothetical protein
MSEEALSGFSIWTYLNSAIWRNLGISTLLFFFVLSVGGLLIGLAVLVMSSYKISPYLFGGLHVLPFFILACFSTEKPLAFGGLITLSFFIASLISTSLTASNDHHFEEAKKEIMTKSWPLTLVAILSFLITTSMYLLDEPNDMMYVLLALACLSLGMSYGSLVISFINS